VFFLKPHSCNRRWYVLALCIRIEFRHRVKKIKRGQRTYPTRIEYFSTMKCMTFDNGRPSSMYSRWMSSRWIVS
jgi:hypothetical protein